MSVTRLRWPSATLAGSVVALALAGPAPAQPPLPRPRPMTAAELPGRAKPDTPVPAPRSAAVTPPAPWPDWLTPHVGTGAGQIARVVLERARALYRDKVSDGVVTNPCYFAMDATRPSGAGGASGRRFYVVCEASRTFTAITAGHGGGRNVRGVANFRNDIRCAKNFGNALDSRLTAGGSYVTAEIRTSFKGYYRGPSGKDAVLNRSFVQFVGEGETANARQRDIGGHAAVLLHHVCLRRDPDSPYAGDKGYVPFGRLVTYAGGRSSGCTSWTRPEAEKIMAMVRDDPTTLYIYPEAADIDAVAQAAKAGRPLSQAGLYWNAACLRAIHAPQFWSRDQLGPILARYKAAHPPGPVRPPPLCRGAAASVRR